MQALHDFGLQSQPIFDEKIHRFDRGSKLNGWYIGFTNQKENGEAYQVVQFGDWKTGDIQTASSGGKLTQSDKDWLAQRKECLDFAKQILQHQTCFIASQIWKTLENAQKHPYLSRKQINPYGVKFDQQNRLTIPLCDNEGHIWGLQYIHPDGTKRFLKNTTKKGKFFKIEGSSQTFIVEGFATGASVHEATGATVIVAFDAGNIKPVADQFPDAIIAGDADEAGRKACQGLKSIFPILEQGTDWNDLHVLEGLDAVKKQLETAQFADSQDSQPTTLETPHQTATDAPQQKIKCLGYNGDGFYFISSSKPQITRISASGFTKSVLLSMCDLDFWESRYGEKKGWNLENATNDLMTLCRSSGYFEPSQIRGSGVWLDEKRTVVNCGDHLVVDNEKMGLADFQSKFIYEQSRKLPTHEILPKPKVDDFLLLLENLSWRQPDSAKLLFGWLAVAPICGALPWRPHIWITGASGSGKTTVMNDIIAKILISHQVMGRSTEAGVRQLVGASAIPLLFDENETTDQASQRRVDSVIELFRQASSESNGFVAKGTPTGKGMSYSVRFCAGVSSVNVGLHLEQDINRFTVLELLKDNEHNGFNDKGGIRDCLFDLLTEDFCKAWRSWSIENVGNILKIKKQIFEKLRGKVNARFAEQYGTMLAGYACFLGYDVDSVVSEFEFHSFENTDKNETDCLAYILQSKIVEGGKVYSISELIEMSKTDPTGEYDKILARYGMRYMIDGLAVACKHAELSKIMRESSNPRKWGNALLRLDCAKRSTVRMNGIPTSVVVVPID